MAGSPEFPDTGQYSFGTTHWTNILGAQDSQASARDRTLEWLCRQYWNPLYAFIRRSRRLDPAAAEDKTQEFFAYLIKNHVVAKADPTRGRFRSFIKGVLRNFLMAEGRREGSLKRGGGKKALSLEAGREDDRAPIDVAANEPGPEEILDREWARRVLELAQEELYRRLRTDKRDQDLELFEAYTHSGQETQPTYKDLAQKYGLSEWDVWKRLSTVRQELREMMKLKVAETVQAPGDADDEMDVLLSLLP